MDFQILPVLDAARVERIVRRLDIHPFVDGKATAQGIARGVKNNQQAERAGAGLSDLDDLVRSALYANHAFQAFAFPRRIRPPVFSRYQPGMEYGAHVDGAIMNDAAGQLRADLAVTIFLIPPDAYDGGELVFELPSGEQEIKLASGEAVVYSASSVHRVQPVTRGVRMAAVTWVHSAVRDERMRAILFDLYVAHKKLEAHEDALLLVVKAYHNLLRITSEF